MAATLNVCIVGPVKILLIEDDSQTADYIAKGLREHGHVVDKTDNGRDGLYMATGEPYDVMIVDRNLPKMDGLSLVKAARASGTRTPVLFLTTMGGVDDRVAGFEAGGDDYLVKPFAFAELLARVGALARRPPIVATTSLKVGDLEVDLLSRAVTRGGKRIALRGRMHQRIDVIADRLDKLHACCPTHVRRSAAHPSIPSRLTRDGVRRHLNEH